MGIISCDITTSFHGKRLRAHDWGAHARPVKGLYFPATLLATFLAILSRFNPDTVTIGYSVEEKSRFNPDTATLGYSVEGFFFPAILSRFNPDTATLGYSVEGFYFLAILSRHCHPWILSGGILFYSDFIAI